jgi:DNA-binding NarL/FixJ family response regulator
MRNLKDDLACAKRAMSKPLSDCVLLADRHHGLSEGIRGLLETTFSSVFLVADETSLIEGARLLRPAVVVVDLSLGAGDVPGLMRELRARAPRAKVLLLSVHDEPSVLRSAVAAGADGIVLKRAIATDLLLAVDEVLAGRRFIPIFEARKRD